MAADARTPLLGDREMVYTIDELEQEDSGVSTADSTASRRSRRNGPAEHVVTITREQLEDLQIALETTSDLIRQVGMDSVELEALSRQRSRHHRIPKCVTNNLLLLTILWQVLNLATVSVDEAFESKSKGGDKQKEKNTFILSVVIIVIFQAFNLVLVFFTTIKLTKQVMHQTVTKSFLAQSFLSTTLLYAGLYTLVYKIDHKAFSNISVGDGPLKTPLIFFKMTFFSISTATLCGVASILPAKLSAQLITSTQMMMSYLYFASVLYLAVQPHKNDLKWKVINRRGVNSQHVRSVNQRIV